MEKYKFGGEQNFSERFQAVVSEQDRDGNDPHNVLETIRKAGVIDEKDLPYTDNMAFEEYLSPKPMITSLLKKAEKWLEKRSFKHEYVYHPYKDIPLKEKQELLLQALKRSPVGVSVYAWTQRNGLYYKPKGARDTHWAVLVAAGEKRWFVFDSYRPYIKELEWDFEFDVAKGVWLGANPSQVRPNRDWLTEMLRSFLEFFLDLFNFRTA